MNSQIKKQLVDCLCQSLGYCDLINYPDLARWLHEVLDPSEGIVKWIDDRPILYTVEHFVYECSRQRVIQSIEHEIKLQCKGEELAKQFMEAALRNDKVAMEFYSKQIVNYDKRESTGEDT